jgi:hypothetical protein
MSWTWDPDPNDTTYVTDYAYMLRESGATELRVVHDRHVEGLFPRATWVTLLGSAGFRLERSASRPTEDNAGRDEVFVAVRP